MWACFDCGGLADTTVSCWVSSRPSDCLGGSALQSRDRGFSVCCLISWARLEDQLRKQGNVVTLF